jgi:hypothetical protein
MQMSKKKNDKPKSYKRKFYSNISQVMEDREKIIRNTEKHINELMDNSIGIEFMRKLKFYSSTGYDPLFEEEMNFGEQINQIWTYMVCLVAVEQLMNDFPEKKFWVSFGDENGYDVESEDGSVVCECFATTNPKNNGKLNDDTKKLSNNNVAKYKYIIFYAQNREEVFVQSRRKKYPDIFIRELETI